MAFAAQQRSISAPPEAETATSAGEMQPGLTGRSLVIALVLTVLAGLWVRQSEILVLSTQITESIPAIPGLAALIFLLPVNALLRRSRRFRPLTRAELLVIFLFVTLSSTMMGVGVTQFMFALLGAPFYFKTDNIPAVCSLLPGWLMPHDLEIVRQMYERSPDGRVPWGYWLAPAGCWLLFFLALWWTLYCLMALFYRIWSEERLAFPQVFIPLAMTGEESGRTPFFRNKLMWSGFLVAALYNLVNILHAFYPSIPAPGKDFDLSPLFTGPPWSEMTPLKIEIRPELVGLGFLVSTEISLTVWLSFFLLKLAAVVGVSLGNPPGQLPYPQEQGIGAYLVLAAMLIWVSRRSLQSLWRAAIRGDREYGPEGISPRWLFAGLGGSFLVVWSLATLAGMAAWVALAYLVLVLAVALVYGRLRAEAGVPLVWLFPYYMQKQVLLYTFGSQVFLASGQTTLPTWALFTFLARGYFPAMTGYQVEGMELARRAHINPRRVVFAICLAVGVGFCIGWYNHLTPFYHYGAQNLRGIWGTWIAQPEYKAAAEYPTTARHPQLPRIWATTVGGLVVYLLWALRLQFAGFLLHPLGYAMTCSYGGLIWFSFLVVWLLKSLALRYGGMAFYRQCVPFFLGLALGHFAVAGILWGLMGGLSGDAVQGYSVFFG